MNDNRNDINDYDDLKHENEIELSMVEFPNYEKICWDTKTMILYKKELEIVGVGYQASVQGNRLKLQLGYSHDIFFDFPDGIDIEADRTAISVKGNDKQLVGSVASKIRSFRKPEPYKGKGVRYKDESIRIKQGKTVGE